MEKIAFVNGIHMAYEEIGEGKPLILIHGLTGNKETMLPFVDLLGEGRKYILVDVRGHGNSDKPSSYTLKDHGDDIAGLIKYLGYEKADVLGYSMGSYIGLLLGEKYSDLIDHLILLASKPDGKTSSVERIVKQAGYDITSINQEKMFDLILQASLTAKNYQNYLQGKFSFDVSALAGKEMTSAQKAAESLSLVNFDLNADLAKVTCSTCVISCAEDGINPPELGKKIAEGIKNSRFELINDASHLVIYENPSALRDIVLDFLSE